MVELDRDGMRLMGMFEGFTGVMPLDLIVFKDKIAFVVGKGKVGRVIGRKGETINRLKSAFKRPVFIFEDDVEIEGFIRNLFQNIRISNIKIGGGGKNKTALVTISSGDRGKAIGKDGGRVKLSRAFLLRKFNCDLRLNFI
jgi:N utilization substance protein A